MKNRQFLYRPIVSISAIMLLLHTFCAFAQQKSDEYYQGIAHGLELFGEVYREILEGYTGEIHPHLLAEQGIAGMMALLDPYSRYVPSEEAVRRATVRIGVGIEVERLDNLLTVVDIYDQLPAAKAGIRIGDRVIAVDGQNVVGTTVEDFYRLLKGERDVHIRLTIMRDGLRDSLHFDMPRTRVRIRSVGYAGIVEDGFIYIKLDRFGENAGNEFRTELLRLARHEHQLEDIHGVIVDLRNNTGGVLEEAVSVADALLPKGDRIVTTDGSDTAEYEEWFSERDPVILDLPLVLLVNNRTASASEILAGAVQDNDRGIIVGEPTVGKGLVQSIYRLPFDASLRLTTAWYITPSGRSIQRINVLNPSARTIIPDSLFGSFKTKHGRLLYGGQGILPDTLVPQISTNTLLVRLKSLHAFFNFASSFTSSLDSLPSNFSVNSTTLLGFEEYAMNRLIQHERDQGIFSQLDSLQSKIRSQRSSRLTGLWKELTQEITTADKAEFAERRDQIKDMLEREIKRRFLSREERVIQGLMGDIQYRVARDLLITQMNTDDEN